MAKTLSGYYDMLKNLNHTHYDDWQEWKDWFDNYSKKRMAGLYAEENKAKSQYSAFLSQSAEQLENTVRQIKSAVGKNALARGLSWSTIPGTIVGSETERVNKQYEKQNDAAESNLEMTVKGIRASRANLNKQIKWSNDTDNSLKELDAVDQDIVAALSGKDDTKMNTQGKTQAEIDKKKKKIEDLKKLYGTRDYSGYQKELKDWLLDYYGLDSSDFNSKSTEDTIGNRLYWRGLGSFNSISDVLKTSYDTNTTMKKQNTSAQGFSLETALENNGIKKNKKFDKEGLKKFQDDYIKSLKEKATLLSFQPKTKDDEDYYQNISVIRADWGKYGYTYDAGDADDKRRQQLGLPPKSFLSLYSNTSEDRDRLRNGQLPSKLEKTNEVAAQLSTFITQVDQLNQNGKASPQAIEDLYSQYPTLQALDKQARLEEYAKSIQSMPGVPQQALDAVNKEVSAGLIDNKYVTKELGKYGFEPGRGFGGIKDKAKADAERLRAQQTLLNLFIDPETSEYKSRGRAVHETVKQIEADPDVMRSIFAQNGLNLPANPYSPSAPSGGINLMNTPGQTKDADGTLHLGWLESSAGYQISNDIVSKNGQVDNGHYAVVPNQDGSATLVYVSTTTGTPINSELFSSPERAQQAADIYVNQIETGKPWQSVQSQFQQEDTRANMPYAPKEIKDTGDFWQDIFNPLERGWENIKAIGGYIGQAWNDLTDPFLNQAYHNILFNTPMDEDVMAKHIEQVQQRIAEGKPMTSNMAFSPYTNNAFTAGIIGATQEASMGIPELTARLAQAAGQAMGAEVGPITTTPGLNEVLNAHPVATYIGKFAGATIPSAGVESMAGKALAESSMSKLMKEFVTGGLSNALPNAIRNINEGADPLQVGSSFVMDMAIGGFGQAAFEYVNQMVGGWLPIPGSSEFWSMARSGELTQRLAPYASEISQRLGSLADTVADNNKPEFIPKKQTRITNLLEENKLAKENAVEFKNQPKEIENINTIPKSQSDIIKEELPGIAPDAKGVKNALSDATDSYGIKQKLADDPIQLTGTGEKITNLNAEKITNIVKDAGHTLTPGDQFVGILGKNQKLIDFILVKETPMQTINEFESGFNTRVYQYEGVGAGGKNPAFVDVTKDIRMQTVKGAGDLENVVDAVGKEKKTLSHFSGKYTLKSNNEYIANNYEYKTDNLGRIHNARAELKLGNGTRNRTHQRKAGGVDRLASDQGGHIFGTRFNGSSLIDNIVAMNKSVNLKTYKRLENEWEKRLKEGHSVNVVIELFYDDISLRPIQIGIKYTIDGEKYFQIIKNSH